MIHENRHIIITYKTISKLMIAAAYLFTWAAILLPTLELFSFSENTMLISYAIMGFVFYIFKIDSKYLFYFSLTFLWLSACMAFYGLATLAEKAAEQVFYLLITGIILQIFFILFKPKLLISFDEIKKMILSTSFTCMIIIFAAAFLISHFTSFFTISALSIYFCTTLIISYVFTKTIAS